MSTPPPPPPASPWTDNRDRYHHRQPAGGPAPVSGPPRHTGIGAKAWIAMILAALIVAFVFLAQIIDVPKVVTSPGPVYDTLGENGSGSPVVQIDGADTYETSGTLDFTTVVQEGGPGYPLSLWEYLQAQFLRDDVAISDYDDLYGPEDTQQGVREQNLALMTDSQDVAGVVALRAAGYDVPEDVLVAGLTEDAPSAGVLEVNDQILQVGGEPVANTGEVQQAVRALEPGTPIDMVVLRDDEEVDLEVPTGEAEGVTVVGAFLSPQFEPPVEVTYNAGNVGGPSAGLMFSLAAYDKLTEGELTDGKLYAGTGTIDSGGNVGPIGGIVQKLHGARDAGAEYFFAPADNCAEVAAAQIPDGLTVIRVGTMDDALAAIEDVTAGDVDSLPSC